MEIKGEYRDILRRNNAAIIDTGWRSNTIADDFGRFLAALMKKDINPAARAGIDYIAVGSGGNKPAEFKKRVVALFNRPGGVSGEPLEIPEKGWIWAKPIDASRLEYLDSSDRESPSITNRIKVDIEFEENEPTQSAWDFEEFGLIGVDKGPDGRPDPDKLFLINYVSHGKISKVQSMTLTRTIVLKFL